LRELGAPLYRRARRCVGVSGSLFNRVRETNRVVGGAVHPCASPSASERIQDWVLGGHAANTDRRSFGARRPHASRSQQHTARAEPPGERRPAASRGRQEFAEQGHGISTRETRAPYTGGGDCHRASEARSSPTRGHYPSVRDQVQGASGEKQARQEKTKKCSKGLDKRGHIEGLRSIEKIRY
jgi:hypothetical protein